MTSYPKHKPVRLKGAAWLKEKKIAFERDGGRCVFCGDDYCLTPAHIVRRSQGGNDTSENIITACMLHHCEFDMYQRDLPESVWERMDEVHREQYMKTRGGKKYTPIDDSIRLCAVCGHGIRYHEDYDGDIHECQLCDCLQFADKEDEK